jgi:heme-degrading monooxygenase HmoA
MILEMAILNIIPGREVEFESTLKLASKLIFSINSYISHQLQRCLESQSKYVLLVNWETLEAHAQGFRESPEHQEWKGLLHHFYTKLPTANNYERIR